MNDWYYRLFGAEFGPITFDELVTLAKEGTLSRDDEVRLGDSKIWRRAGSMGQLMAHFPYETENRGLRAKAQVSSRQTSPELVATTQEVRSSGASDFSDIFAAAPASDLKSPSRELKTPSKELKSPSRELKVPSKELEASSNESKTPSKAKTPSKELELYWCLIQGKEYGPVERQKLFEWAASGRLLRSDSVRIGQASFVLASDAIPGLFTAPSETIAADTKPALEAITETQVSNIRKPTVSDSPKTTSSSDVNSVTEATKPTPSNSSASSPPASNPIPTPTPLSSGFGTGPVAASRPYTPVHRPPVKKADSGRFNELLTGKPAMAVGGVLLLGVVIYFLLPFISFGQSANAKRFKELQRTYSELAKLRNADNVSPDSFTALKLKFESVAKKVSLQVKGSKDPQDKRVSALAKKMEELSKEKLGSKPAASEADFEKALKETGKKLGAL